MLRHFRCVINIVNVKNSDEENYSRIILFVTTCVQIVHTKKLQELYIEFQRALLTQTMECISNARLKQAESVTKKKKDDLKDLKFELPPIPTVKKNFKLFSQSYQSFLI